MGEYRKKEEGKGKGKDLAPVGRGRARQAAMVAPLTPSSKCRRARARPAALLPPSSKRLPLSCRSRRCLPPHALPRSATSPPRRGWRRMNDALPPNEVRRLPLRPTTPMVAPTWLLSLSSLPCRPTAAVEPAPAPLAPSSPTPPPARAAAVGNPTPRAWPATPPPACSSASSPHHFGGGPLMAVLAVVLAPPSSSSPCCPAAAAPLLLPAGTCAPLLSCRLPAAHASVIYSKKIRVNFRERVEL